MTARLNYEKMKAEKEKLRQQMEAQASAVFQEGAKELFDRYPELHGFRWTQYTPHFNDGDTCTFSVHGDYPGLLIAESALKEHTKAFQAVAKAHPYNNGQTSYKPEESDGWSSDEETEPINVGEQLAHWADHISDTYYDGMNAHEIPSKVSAMGREVSKLLSSLDEEDFLQLWGDHSRVFVLRDGTIDTEVYDHD